MFLKMHSPSLSMFHVNVALNWFSSLWFEIKAALISRYLKLNGYESLLLVWSSKLKFQCFNLLQEKTLETSVKPCLRSWFEDAICPIQRVVQLFQEKLAFLLHAVSVFQTGLLKKVQKESQ